MSGAVAADERFEQGIARQAVRAVQPGAGHLADGVEAGNVSLAIALTIPECPVVSQLGAEAAREVTAVPGVRKVRVRLDPTLPWDPSRLSPEAKELYRKRFAR